MFKKTLLIVALASLSAGAFANEYTDSAQRTDFKSTKTRAEVRAELDAARAAGELQHGEADPTYFVSKVKSIKTRAEVKAELAAYIKSGQRDRDAVLYMGGPF